MTGKIAFGTEIRSLAVVLLLAILCVGGALGFYSEVSRFRANAERLNEANRRAHALKDLLSTLQDAETGQRGFVITGSPEFLEPYTAALSRFDDLYRALKAEYAEPASSHSDLHSVHRVASEKLSHMAHTIQVRKDQGFEAAQDIVRQGEGKQLMDRMRVLISRMLESEHRAITHDAAISHKEGEMTFASLLAGGTCILIMVAFLVHLTVSEAQKNRRLNQQLAFACNHDALTGIANRRAFSEALERATQAAADHGPKPGLLYLDLNGFKPINDQLGHEVGDRVLVEVAQRLKATVRGSNLVARLGGDEFAILLPSVTHQEDLRDLRGRVQQAVSEVSFAALEGRRVSASVGYAIYPDDGTPGTDLLSIADEAMYAEKSKLVRKGDSRVSPLYKQSVAAA